MMYLQKHLVYEKQCLELYIEAPVPMEGNQPPYWAGPVGETVFILCSDGEIVARWPRQRYGHMSKMRHVPVVSISSA